MVFKIILGPSSLNEFLNRLAAEDGSNAWDQVERGCLVDRSLGLRVPPKRFGAIARVAPGEFSRPQAAARRAGGPRRGSS
jgi:hypothetical protein